MDPEDPKECPVCHSIKIRVICEHKTNGAVTWSCRKCRHYWKVK